MTDPFARDLIDMAPRLRRFALSLCRRADLADDLVQTACEKALAARARFEPGTRFDAWMFRILRNAWLDGLRAGARAGPSIDIADVAETLAAPAAEQAESRLMLRAAEAAIAALPEDQRTVLLLVCVEGLSYRETAETVGAPIGTVMSRLSRARAKITETMGIEAAPTRSAGKR